MKKSILSLCLLLVVATVTNAAPRFGIIGEQESGLGAFVTDDMYNFQLTVGQATTDFSFANLTAASATQTEESLTKISVGANYKIALDSVTSLTAGVSASFYSGYSFLNSSIYTAELDSATKVAVNMGFERALSSNIVLTTQASAYTSTNAKFKSGTEVKSTSLFSNGRVGVAYLF
ncbi:MAG: hypothetical protein VW397_02010 [Candidatus Margulisiibacteriota bacterium]